MTSMATPTRQLPVPLAERRGTPPIVVEILKIAPHLEEQLRHGDASDRARLAAGDDCPPEVLELLATDKPTVVLEAAGNPDCPPTVLAEILQRADTSPRRHYWLYEHTHHRVLTNPSCPVEILRRAHATEETTILQNPSCPQDLVRSSSLSEDTMARYLAAGHPRLPDEDLLRLMHDSDSMVAWQARVVIGGREDPHTIRVALGSLRGEARRTMMERLPTRHLQRLADDPDPWLRRGAARVTGDRDLLARLAADPNGHVRRAATQRLMEVLAA
jgi:hypothetical protein